MRTLIINFKNYREICGSGSLKLALAAERASRRSRSEIIVAPPAPMLATVTSEIRINVFSQTADSSVGEKTTGSLIPEAISGAGATGVILNHSEAMKTRKEIANLIPRLSLLKLKVCLCARSAREAASLAAFSPDYLAVEPRELIGSGIAISRAKPGLVTRTVAAARKAGFEGQILCGAGIVDGADVRRAAELGADGVLVSSGVVKARDWEAKIEELARSLN